MTANLFQNRQVTALMIGSIGVGMIPAFSVLGSLIVLAAGLFSFSFGAFKEHKWFWLVLVQYCAVNLFFNIYHTGQFGISSHDESYVIVPLALIAVMSLFAQAGGQLRLVVYGMTVGMVLCVLLLSYNLFGQGQCRVEGFMWNPLPLAALFSVLAIAVALISYASLQVKNELGYLALFLLFVLLTAYLGARMSFYVAFILIITLCFYLSIIRKESLKALAVLTSVALAISVGCGIDHLTGCGFLNRVQQSIESVATILSQLMSGSINSETQFKELYSSGVHVSEGARFALWKAGLALFFEQPLLGFGHIFEGDKVGPKADVMLPHAHQQYLSWALWGGVFSLVSGFIMLFAPIFLAKRKLFVAFFVAPVILVFLTDSLMFRPDMLSTFFVLYAVLFVLAQVFADDIGLGGSVTKPCKK